MRWPANPRRYARRWWQAPAGSSQSACANRARIAAPFEIMIGVGRILNGVIAAGGDPPPPVLICASLAGGAAAQHRCRRSPTRRHPGEPGQPAAAVQSHQQRFGLIIGMMRGGGDSPKPCILRPLRQRRIASGARLSLQIARLRGGGDGGEGNACARPPVVRPTRPPPRPRPRAGGRDRCLPLRFARATRRGPAASAQGCPARPIRPAPAGRSVRHPATAREIGGKACG